MNLLLLFLVVVWIALIAWTFLDARRRIRDPVLVACATGASLFPYVGTVVYAILRPPEFLEDAHERELEIRAAELRLRQLEEQSCPSCGYPIERTYLRCPNCRARVKDPCEACEKPIDPRWTVCPYCETPQRRAAPAAPGARGGAPRPRTPRGARGAAEADARAKRPRRRAEGRRAAEAVGAPAPRHRPAAPAPRRRGAKQRKAGSGTRARPLAAAQENPGEDALGPATAS